MNSDQSLMLLSSMYIYTHQLTHFECCLLKISSQHYSQSEHIKSQEYKLLNHLSTTCCNQRKSTAIILRLLANTTSLITALHSSRVLFFFFATDSSQVVILNIDLVRAHPTLKHNAVVEKLILFPLFVVNTL